MVRCGRCAVALVGMAGAALVGAVLTEGPAVRAADFTPGLGLDEPAEKRLGAAVEGLLKRAAGENADYLALAAGIAAARPDALRLAALAAKADPAEPDTPAIPVQVPYLLPGVEAGAKPPAAEAARAAVHALWAGQLRMNLRAAQGLLAGDKATVSEWVGWPDYNRRENRARPMADALREAHKCALLLARPPEDLRIRRGEALFTDDLDTSPARWFLYGPAENRITDKGLRRRNLEARNADTMMWTRQEFNGNFLVEFTFVPNVGGGGPGVLFAICGRPVRPGADLSVSCGETMDTYNKGVHAYHFSIHRGETGLSNGRKVGSGLKMLASGPDPAREVGRAYRVAIGKCRETIFLIVDGRLLHHYVDGGTYGPVLAGGSVGLRHWGGMDATYARFRVERLLAADGAAED